MDRAAVCRVFVGGLLAITSSAARADSAGFGCSGLPFGVREEGVAPGRRVCAMNVGRMVDFAYRATSFVNRGVYRRPGQTRQQGGSDVANALPSTHTVGFYSPHGPHAGSTLPVIVILADGVRPDTLRAAIDEGAVPSLSRLRSEGGLFTATTCFPSVTGPAYTPFLMGRFPGPIGLPGLRWFDRERRTCSFPDYARSYVGYQMAKVNADLDATALTIFEQVKPSFGALSVITRGLDGGDRVGAVSIGNVGSMVKVARTHFTGDLAGWLDIDRLVATEVAARIVEQRPQFVFAALTGIDKTSHAAGHTGPLVIEALRIVDALVRLVRRDAERNGYWKDTHLWVASDHGHWPLRAHEDLAAFVSSLGYRVIAHPWVFAIAPEVAVMVSGNAMAHLYLDLRRRQRPYWESLSREWRPLVDALLGRPAVDVVVLPHRGGRAEVRARGRGSAFVRRDGNLYSYERMGGDPLGLGNDLVNVSADQAYDVTFNTEYPDSVVQIIRLAESPRSGDVILSASRDWDLRARYEPIPHVSSHGALHREHMLVPLLLNRPPTRAPRRTVDVMPSALHALEKEIPGGLDGTSFL